ncbi:uncharacterized protein ARMOST_20511 [Armillaria ostoyae]|uniref:Uncharacterized protein n=1 Tax=Armillaria ostoyae TaxID=47428 RepID=A0A284S7J7_ARMOS|nr:uncharacterized protein ARMOST_20511 [Armillaria ostoyae]
MAPDSLGRLKGIGVALFVGKITKTRTTMDINSMSMSINPLGIVPSIFLLQNQRPIKASLRRSERSAITKKLPKSIIFIQSYEDLLLLLQMTQPHSLSFLSEYP